MKSKLSQLIAFSFVGVMSFAFFSCSNEKSSVKLTDPVSTEKEDEVVPDNEPVIKVPEKKIEVVKPDPAIVEAREPSKMQKILKGNTVYIEDGEATRRDSKKEAEYYVVYFTADWSGKCKKNIDLVKQFYTDHVKNDPKVEFVMASSDDPKWLIKWAVSEKFEWPLLLRENLKEVDFLAKLGEKYAYYFVMYDADGNSKRTVTLENCVNALLESKAKSSADTDKE